MDKRRRTEEQDREVDLEYILPDKAIYTSSWNSKITDMMKIKVYSEGLFSLEEGGGDNPLYLNFMLDNMWQKDLDIEKLPTVARIKTLIDKVNIIHNVDSNILEQEVDTFTQTLLISAGMDDYPLSTNPRPKLFTEIGENRERITSIPDFLIRSKKIKILTVIEDKNSNNAIFANQWMENQLLGELFVAAHNIKLNKPFDVFGVRIIGTLFTFFRAKITPEYIKESSLGLPIKTDMTVLRYPDPGDEVYEINALDFCKLEDRKIIINYLERIKEILLKESTPIKN